MGKMKVNTGVLEFLEPKNDKIVDLSLVIDSEKLERTTRLVEIVYEKIMNLDFPKIDNYSEDLKGIIDFEDYLLGE